MFQIKMTAGADATADSEEPLPRGLNLYWSPPKKYAEEEDAGQPPERAGAHPFELPRGDGDVPREVDEQTPGR